jgi:hypothetical protein
MIKPNYHLTKRQQREAYLKMRACQVVTILTVSVSAAVALHLAVEVITWFML